MKVFVGCSSEASEHEDFVKETLEKLKIEHIDWRQSTDTSSYLLPSLLQVARDCDGAILLLTADDLTHSRGRVTASPRDNVVLEAGLFFATKGLQRVALIQFPDSDGNWPDLPSDFNGLQIISADPKQPTILKKKLLAWKEASGVNEKGILEYIDRIVREDRELDTKPLDSRFLDIAKRCIIHPLVDELHSLDREEIRLSHAEYYSEIKRLFSDIDKVSSIDAVSTLSSSVWTKDFDQRRYNEQNLAAAKHVKIRRLFVSSPADFQEFSSVFNRQSDSGINVKFLSLDATVGMSNLTDFVCFNLKDGCRIIFSSENAANRNIKNGKLTFSQGKQSDPRVRAFKSAWDIAYDPREVEHSELREGDEGAVGLKMEVLDLPTNVVTCQEAATAKGIDLQNELKSLILATSDGLIVAHLQGDRRLSLRKVKDYLSVDEAYIASDDLIKEHGLISGTVSAVLEPVWSFTHLIDKDIFDLEFVSTNAGVLNRYFRFDPKVLVTAKKIHIASISE